MDNYNDLNASNLDEKDAIVSLHLPKENNSNEKRIKITLISSLLSTLKYDNFKPRELNSENLTFKQPLFKYSLITLLIAIGLFAILLIMRPFIDLVIAIPLFVIFLSISVPSIIMVFFIEFNTRKSINSLSIILMIILGIFCFAIIEAVCNNFLVRFFFISYVDSIGKPICWMIALYVLIFIFCNILKVTKLPECILISVSFAIGYSIAQSMSLAFSNLFIPTEITIAEGNAKIFVPLILNSSEQLYESFTKLKSGWFLNHVYFPLLYSFLAVIVGTVISHKERSKAEKRHSVKSTYLLIIVSLTLFIMSVTKTNFIYFDITLKILSFICCAFLTIKILDICLEREITYVS